MAYKVVITAYARHQLEMYIAYTLAEFKNKQAAKAIMEDAARTKKKLADVAESLAICEDAMLAKYGYRRILFEKHDFFMVYRLDGNKAVVEAMFHELQDYESLFASKLRR